eukprot:TRINITY_DN13997_c0_g1_i3.p1 TRINITY_DN13997_c0_g1~~TRINITY_DN13997_c0_g1_i3.p1  ORF type:complete len:476 (-),score=117.76 TRINITY_DN13997_c0_g1_i3:561-1988(-)
MAKITYRRTTTVSTLDMAVSLFLIIGAFFFIGGSVLFWPKLGKNPSEDRRDLTIGAWMFVVGSCIYTLSSAIEFQAQVDELSETEHLEDAIDDQASAKEHFLNITTNARYLEAYNELSLNKTFCLGEAHQVKKKLAHPEHPSVSQSPAGSTPLTTPVPGPATEGFLSESQQSNDLLGRSHTIDCGTLSMVGAAAAEAEGGESNQGSPTRSSRASSISRISDSLRARGTLLSASQARNTDAPQLVKVKNDEERDEQQLRALLYQRFIVKCQKLQTLIFLCGGVLFVLGSIFFLPQVNDWFSTEAIRLTHGCWLYLAGSFVFMIGAYLGKRVGVELVLTGKPLRYNFRRGKHLHHIYWWSDEQVNVVSCHLLMVGTLCFVLGTVFFFPGWPQGAAHAVEHMAALFFIIGSIFFAGSAVVDYLRLWRRDSKYTQFEVHHDYMDTEPLSYGALRLSEGGTIVDRQQSSPNLMPARCIST